MEAANTGAEKQPQTRPPSTSITATAQRPFVLTVAGPTAFSGFSAFVDGTPWRPVCTAFLAKFLPNQRSTRSGSRTRSKSKPASGKRKVRHTMPYGHADWKNFHGGPVTKVGQSWVHSLRPHNATAAVPCSAPVPFPLMSLHAPPSPALEELPDSALSARDFLRGVQAVRNRSGRASIFARPCPAR